MELLDLISKRAALASNIGSLKTDGVIYRPEREAQVLRRLVEQNQGPLSNESIESIYKSIMSNCRALEKQITVAFLGPLGTFSEEASMKQFGESIVSMQTSSIDEVFHLVESHKAHYGVVPVENSTEGAINRTLDLLLTSNTMICAEIILPVHHNLLVLNGQKIEDIKEVYSHAQGLSQCSKFIKENNITEHIRADTAGSAEMISKTKDVKQAAIASSLSAEIYGLDIIQKNIENERGNLTRFLVMGKNISQPEFESKKYITSFLFKLKSKPAALYQSLGGFAINGVNLTKLQSYPEKNTFDSFFFLCDLDGHIEDPKVQKSLEELGLHCEDFHVLGVFEADKLREKKN